MRFTWTAYGDDVIDYFREKSIIFRDTTDNQEHDAKNRLSIPSPSSEKPVAEVLSVKKNRPKCEQTSKIFQDLCENDHSQSLKKFIQFLKQKEKENRNEDDLGFEINFEVFQPEPKVSFCTVFEDFLI